MVMFQILLDGAEPCDAETTQLSSPVCRRRLNKECICIGLKVSFVCYATQFFCPIVSVCLFCVPRINNAPT